MANVFDNVTVAKHIVAESSLLKSTICGHIYDLRMAKDTDNGTIVARGDWESTTPDGQVFETKDYAVGDWPLLVLTTPIGYDTARKGRSAEKWFYNATGEIARAYELAVGDIFTVSAEAITALSTSTGAVVGNSVQITTTGTKGLYKEVAKTGASAIKGMRGIIVDKVVYGDGQIAYRIFVDKLGIGETA